MCNTAVNVQCCNKRVFVGQCACALLHVWLFNTWNAADVGFPFYCYDDVFASSEATVLMISFWTAAVDRTVQNVWKIEKPSQRSIEGQNAGYVLASLGHRVMCIPKLLSTIEPNLTISEGSKRKKYRKGKELTQLANKEKIKKHNHNLCLCECSKKVAPYLVQETDRPGFCRPQPNIVYLQWCYSLATRTLFLL